MQTLKRNKRAVYYANCIGQSETDENGVYSGEISPVHGQPVLIMANVSPVSGFVSVQPFGLAEEYDAVLQLDTSLPITAETVFWLECTPPEMYDHVVSRVSRSLNALSVAVKKVKTRA